MKKAIKNPHLFKDILFGLSALAALMAVAESLGEGDGRFPWYVYSIISVAFLVRALYIATDARLP